MAQHCSNEVAWRIDVAWWTEGLRRFIKLSAGIPNVACTSARPKKWKIEWHERPNSMVPRQNWKQTGSNVAWFIWRIVHRIWLTTTNWYDFFFKHGYNKWIQRYDMNFCSNMVTTNGSKATISNLSGSMCFLCSLYGFDKKKTLIIVLFTCCF